MKLTTADTLVRAQAAYSTLNTVASVLPWVVLLMFVVGVYLARRRYRALRRHRPGRGSLAGRAGCRAC